MGKKVSRKRNTGFEQRKKVWKQHREEVDREKGWRGREKNENVNERGREDGMGERRKKRGNDRKRD